MTAISLLRAMCAHKKTLQELVVGFQRYPQVLVNVRVREKRPSKKSSLFSAWRMRSKINSEVGAVVVALLGDGIAGSRYD